MRGNELQRISVLNPLALKFLSDNFSVSFPIGKNGVRISSNLMTKAYLSLAIPAHQPVENLSKVIEKAYVQSQLSFIQKLEAHPAIRIFLHFSGGLLEWLEGYHH